MPEIKTRSHVKRKLPKKKVIKAKSVVKRRDFNREKLDPQERAYHKMLEIAQQINQRQDRLKQKDKSKKEDMLKQARRDRNRKKQPKSAGKGQPKSAQKEAGMRVNGRDRRGFLKFAKGKKTKYLERGRLKYFLGKGNNYPLMCKLIEKRGWWESVDTGDNGTLTRKGPGPGQLHLDAHDQRNQLRRAPAQLDLPEAADQPLRESRRDFQQNEPVQQPAPRVPQVQPGRLQHSPGHFRLQLRRSELLFGN